MPVVLWTFSPATARVIDVTVLSKSDLLNGAYERISGRVNFAVRLDNVHNAGIVDLRQAENLKDGEVRFSADFIAVRPKDPKRGNGDMLLEVVNRGHPGLLALIDQHGDWLLQNGYTVVSLGWQWDATGEGALRLEAPIAKDGTQHITGLVRGDLMPSHPMDQIPLAHLITGRIGGSEYTVAAPDDPRDTLTVRGSPLAERTVIPRTQWSYVGNSQIALHGGFQPGKIYEYVYVAADPVIAGLGFAAVRDFASYAKHSPDAIAPATHVIAQGTSQDGRFLRDFLYQGFNADENGRMALDGVLAHVAGAGRGSFNYRFAQPSRDAQPTSSIFFPTDLFPFTDEPELDPITRERAGLLDRAELDKVTPKIFFTTTSYEYWGRAAALIHVTADGKRDATISKNVRIYHFTGLQHFSGPFPPAKGKGDLVGQEPESPLPAYPLLRAIVANMHAWLSENTPPPPSSYPLLANGTLVPLSQYKFPAIPGIHKPHDANAAYRLDFGPHWQDGILSVQPPKVGKSFPVLIPQVDRDGNERDGIHLPEITVPLATYTGWNLRDPSIGAPDQRVSFEGSYIPFPRTLAERKRTGDPRESIEERYANREEYLKKYGAAIDDLVARHWILSEDKAELLVRAEREWDVATH